MVAGCKARSATVLEGCRCLPEARSRTSAGRVVEADKKLRMSETVFDGLTLRGIAEGAGVLAFEARWSEEGVYSLLPPLMSTKIWMLSAGNDLAEVEEVADDDRERMMK